MEKQDINEDKITEYVIDFAELRENKLDESFLSAFGNITKILRHQKMCGKIFTVIPINTLVYILTLSGLS